MEIESQALQHQSQYSDRRRKLLGIHYTPEIIIDYIVHCTLQPCLEKADSEASRNVTVVDPACGAGLFLLRAFDLICHFWIEHFGHLSAEDVRYILENSLYGVDIDKSAVQATRDNLMRKAQDFGVGAADLDHTICQGDALMRPVSHEQLEMPFHVEQSGETFNWHRRFPQVFAQGGFDCVIGNPPYIRIQHIQPLERRAKYIELYETASGRFDIAGLFIELANSITKPGGRIGYIVSNKLLSINGASELRNFILKHYNLVEIVDLTDTKLFTAAILPMILIMERTQVRTKALLYTSIQEAKTTHQSSLPVEHLLSPLERRQTPSRMNVEWNGRRFRIERFESPMPNGKKQVWTFHHPTEREILAKLSGNTFCTLDSIACKIGVGLKTTADDVFIKPMNLDFVRRHKFEQEIVHPILESHNIQRWGCDWEPERDLYVLYPHQEQDGKVTPVHLEDYPNAEQYLLSNREQLESRAYVKKGGRRWYEIWVHQSPGDFAQLKLITPDIAPENRFALDTGNYFVNGTCFYIILKDQSIEYNLLILALLNSKVLEFFHKVTSGNALYAKRFRYWASYLKPYPIPDLAHPRNSTIVKQIIKNTGKLVEMSGEKEIANLESENDRLTYQLFGLTDQEIEELEYSLSFQSVVV
jgi:adenine-specific DNA-methyltransferase